MYLHAHLSIRAVIVNSLSWVNEQHEGDHQPDEQELCGSHPPRTAPQGQILGRCCQI